MVFEERGNVRVGEEIKVDLLLGVVGTRPRPPVGSHRRRCGYGGGRWWSTKVEEARGRPRNVEAQWVWEECSAFDKGDIFSEIKFTSTPSNFNRTVTL